MHLAKPEASSGLELGEKGQVDVSFGFIKISTIYLNDKIMIANKKHFRLSFLKLMLDGEMPQSPHWLLAVGCGANKIKTTENLI